jgi:hypothetical protein
MALIGFVIEMAVNIRAIGAQKGVDGSKEGVEEEKDEELVVVAADTVRHERTMMIKIQNAMLASMTVITSTRALDITDATKLGLEDIGVLARLVRLDVRRDLRPWFITFTPRIAINRILRRNNGSSRDIGAFGGNERRGLGFLRLGGARGFHLLQVLCSISRIDKMRGK